MPEAFRGSPSQEEARQRVLRDFADDVCRLLAEDTTPVGRVLYAHIRRQTDLVRSERYTTWFREVGGRLGFDQAATLAAVAGSDVTKGAPFSETARANFGTSEDRVAALARQNDLRYGRVFTPFTPLENTYLHAEAGRHYTQAELTRRGCELLGSAAEEVAREASEGILGHDSFNAGFGRHKLKPLLAAQHGEQPEAFDYPRSETPVGFLVQVLDRLEGCDPDTMLRYVEEGCQRKESLAEAIQTGVVENYAYLCEVSETIVRDATEILTPAQLHGFLKSPAMRDFTRGLTGLPRILALVRENQSSSVDGSYCIRRGAEWLRIDSIAGFRTHFLAAVEADADGGQ